MEEGSLLTLGNDILWRLIVVFVDATSIKPLRLTCTRLRDFLNDRTVKRAWIKRHFYWWLSDAAFSRPLSTSTWSFRMSLCFRCNKISHMKRACANCRNEWILKVEASHKDINKICVKCTGCRKWVQRAATFGCRWCNGTIFCENCMHFCCETYLEELSPCKWCYSNEWSLDDYDHNYCRDGCGNDYPHPEEDSYERLIRYAEEYEDEQRETNKRPRLE